MASWHSADELYSLLGAEVEFEARRRLEEPIRAELFAQAAEMLRLDLVRFDAEIAAFDGDIQALEAELADKKRLHAQRVNAYHKTPFELKTNAAGEEVEQARRLVFGASERLRQLKHKRTEAFERRQSISRALAMLSQTHSA